VSAQRWVVAFSSACPDARRSRAKRPPRWGAGAVRGAAVEFPSQVDFLAPLVAGVEALARFGLGLVECR
jgi:hypothetical protein